jgi:hypothetical protein
MEWKCNLCDDSRCKLTIASTDVAIQGWWIVPETILTQNIVEITLRCLIFNYSLKPPFRTNSSVETSRFKSSSITNNKHEKCHCLLTFFSLCMQLHLQLPFLFNCSHKTLRDAEIALQVFPLFFFRLYFPSAINKCVHENWYFRMHESLYLMILWSRISTINEHVSMEVHVNRKRCHRKSYVAITFTVSTHHQTLYYRVSFYIGLVLRLFYAYFNSFCH